MSGPRDDLLSEAGKRLYDHLAEIIPGFHPVLDAAALAIYVYNLERRVEYRERLERAKTDQEREVYAELLAMLEGNIREWAEALGLTPASYREITQAISVAFWQ